MMHENRPFYQQLLYILLIHATLSIINLLIVVLLTHMQYVYHKCNRPALTTVYVCVSPTGQFYYRSKVRILKSEGNCFAFDINAMLYASKNKIYLKQWIYENDLLCRKCPHSSIHFFLNPLKY